MKAAVYTQYGEIPDVLKIKEHPKPQPKANEVLVKVYNASINSWDHDLVTGLPKIYRLIFGIFKPKYTIPGIDISGSVEAVGANVSKFAIGDLVVGDISESAFGGFAEYVCAKESNLMLKPDYISSEHASTLPHAGGLAYQGLFDHRPIKKGDEILINGAGGCAGPIALQLAKMQGATVTVVDNASKLDKLIELGADQVIDYKKVDFTKQDKKYDLILELIGNRSLFKYKRCLKPQGVLSVSGGTISCILQTALFGPLFSNKRGKKMGILLHRPNTSLAALLQLYKDGHVKAVIDKVFPLEELPVALPRLGKGDSFGKMVIKITY